MTKTEVKKLQVASQGAQDFIRAFDGAFIERTVESNALLLATVAELPIVLLGPPGTAKSKLISEFAKATGKSFFQYLITKFTTPDELFGQFKLSALKKDRLERAWENTSVDAEFIFYDEVFKGGSALLNALLTALNEKQCDIGTGRVAMNYALIAGASNELPEQGVGLEALWDRWALRLWVEDIKTDPGFERLWEDDTIGDVTAVLDFKHIEHLRTVRDTVCCKALTPLMKLIRAKLMDDGITMSSRKWRAVKRAVRANAVINGRAQVKRSDITVLNLMAWNSVDDIPTVLSIVNELSQGEAAKILKIASDLCALQGYSFGRASGLMQDVKHYILAGQAIAQNEGWDSDCKDNFEVLVAQGMHTIGQAMGYLNSLMQGYSLTEFAEMAKNLNEIKVFTDGIQELKREYAATAELPKVEAELKKLREAVTVSNGLFQSMTNQL